MKSVALSSFGMLLKREFWENRGSFWTLPLGIGGFFVFVTVALLTALSTVINEIDGEKFLLTRAVAAIKEVPKDQLDVLWDLNLLGSSAIYHLILLFVVFFYFLGSLYDDRRDRSFLFWKSLPISDTKTTLSKLVAGSLVAPFLWVIAIALMHVAMLIIASVLFLFSDIPVYEYLWGPADPLNVWTFMLAAYFVQAFWMLPVWGWAILASAFARSKPFLWAVAPPVLLGIVYQWITATQYLSFDFSYWQVLGNRLLGGVVPIELSIQNDSIQVGTLSFDSDGVTESPASWASVFERFGQADLWWGVAFGVVCIAAAIYIRRYRDDA
ncbi:MAG: hypothetical protein AAGB27_12275 [Pseudomonadota bacterium]